MTTAFAGLAYPDVVTTPAVLGWQPIPIQATFVRGQDWIVNLTPAVTPDTPIWPAGASITVLLYPPDTDVSQPSSTWTQLFSWDATISGNNVSIKAPAADCDTVSDGALIRVLVVLPPNSDHYIWLQGQVACGVGEV